MEHVELCLRMCRQRYGIYAALLVLYVQRDQRDADKQYVRVSQFLKDFKKSVACVGPVSVNIVVRQCFAMKTHKTQSNYGSSNKVCVILFLLILS
jgi:hypothetical protein